MVDFEINDCFEEVEKIQEKCLILNENAIVVLFKECGYVLWHLEISKKEMEEIKKIMLSTNSMLNYLKEKYVNDGYSICGTKEEIKEEIKLLFQQ